MKKRNAILPAEKTLRAQIPVAMRALRINAGLSQQTVADILHVSRPTYSYYERGTTMPDAPALYRLALFYGVAIDVFFIPGAVPILHPDVKRVREQL